MRFATFVPALALVLALGAGAAHAQTTSTSTGTTTGTYPTGTTSATPGTPNTGAGGNAADNALMLVSTGAVALLGATYLLRSRTR